MGQLATREDIHEQSMHFNRKDSKQCYSQNTDISCMKAFWQEVVADEAFCSRTHSKTNSLFLAEPGTDLRPMSCCGQDVKGNVQVAMLLAANLALAKQKGHVKAVCSRENCIVAHGMILCAKVCKHDRMAQKTSHFPVMLRQIFPHPFHLVFCCK